MQWISNWVWPGVVTLISMRGQLPNHKAFSSDLLKLSLYRILWFIKCLIAWTTKTQIILLWQQIYLLSQQYVFRNQNLGRKFMDTLMLHMISHKWIWTCHWQSLMPHYKAGISYDCRLTNQSVSKCTDKYSQYAPPGTDRYASLQWFVATIGNNYWTFVITFVAFSDRVEKLHL